MPALLLWFVAGVALADDIVFSDLAVSADDGITLRYALTAATVDALARSYQMGIAPRISVQVVSGGMNKTSHVELREPSRTVALDSGNWPPGLTATVKLVSGAGALDRLRAPQGSGTELRVSVEGGKTGAMPLGIPAEQTQTASRTTGGAQITMSGPDPSGSAPPPDPAAVIAAIGAGIRTAEETARMIEEQRRIAAEQQRIAEERARARAWLQGILDDPSHPVHAACASKLSGGLFEDCVNIAAFRDDGAAEVSVCMKLDSPGGRNQCFESLGKRAYSARAALDACVSIFGTGEDGLRCTNAVIESRQDPAADVRACGAGFTAADDRMSCIGRFLENPRDVSGVIAACASTFRDDAARQCLGIAAEGSPGPDTIAACGAGFESRDAIECLVALRPVPTGAALVPVCTSLFPASKDRLQCLDRARRDPNPGRIAACSGVAEAKRLRCVEGP